MPIYEYRCTECRDKREVMQSISAKPLKKCEKCGGKLEKLISMNAFHLKGAGWYKTDYSPTGNNEKGDTKKETKSSDKVKKATKEKGDNKSAA